MTEELCELVERFDLSLGTFMDDLFAVDLKRLRAELATPGICRILREMGVSHVHLGLESGSDRILKSIK